MVVCSGGGGSGGCVCVRVQVIRVWYGLFFNAVNGVRISVVAVKFHNVYDYTIVRHPWQVSENHKPRVHPSHLREIGQSVGYLTKHKIELIIAHKLA